MRRYHLPALTLLLCSSILIASCDSSGSEEPDINAIDGTWEADLDNEGPGGEEFEVYAIINDDDFTLVFLNDSGTPDCWEQTRYTLTHEEGLNYVLTRAGADPIDVTIFREDNVLTVSGFGILGDDTVAYTLAEDVPDFDPECDD